jgi:murein DD-endopeptidase MepM/ murein hydrolase activator NlpD
MLDGLSGSDASARVALVRTSADDTLIPAEKDEFSFVVDLASEPVSPRWFRGLATLAMLCGAALVLTPAVDPFSPALARSVAPSGDFQKNPMLGAQSDSGSPAKYQFPADPETAARPVVASNASEIRIQGAVTDGLYWSLRDAGVPSQIAADYLHALSTRIDVGSDVAPYDRFDLVISKTTQPGADPLVYAAIHRAEGADVELMKWTAGGKTDWFDTDASGADHAAGLMAPVAGRITSGFGMRYHPILHFMRMHTGIDFGAAWGSPIVAAADGQVVAAGWTGGYGEQVQVAHGGGIVSTYSHMSGIAASPGQMVRQGQVIGYVGSTGLSTGPHLHFEVRLNGQPVDPMSVRMQSRSLISGPERQAFNERLKQVLAVGA